MDKDIQNYWLNISPDTFIWEKQGAGLMYDARTNTTFRYDCDGKTAHVIQRLLDPVNLYTIEISEKELQSDRNLNAWIDTVVSAGMGKLVPVDGRTLKPFSLVPTLNLQNRMHESEGDSSDGKNVMSYLHQVIFYLGGKNAKECGTLYKQIEYPVDTSEWLPVETVAGILEASGNSALYRIALVGNIFGHPQCGKLAAILNHSRLHIDLIMLYEDFDREAWSRFTSDHIKTFFLCDAATHPVLRDGKYIFTVSSTDECEQVEQWVSESEIGDYSIVPVYTGENLSFFKQEVFITPQDLSRPGLTRREVFAHQALNTFFFGKLSVMPDGYVYGNTNRPPLGTAEEPLHRLVYNELHNGGSWRLIRDQEPCTRCLYRWLCPSPSNYELAIKRPHLCYMAVL